MRNRCIFWKTVVAVLMFSVASICYAAAAYVYRASPPEALNLDTGCSYGDFDFHLRIQGHNKIPDSEKAILPSTGDGLSSE